MVHFLLPCTFSAVALFQLDRRMGLRASVASFFGYFHLETILMLLVLPLVVLFSARNESLPEATLLVVQLLAQYAFSFENSPPRLDSAPALTFSVDGKLLNPDQVYALESAWYMLWEAGFSVSFEHLAHIWTYSGDSLREVVLFLLKDRKRAELLASASIGSVESQMGSHVMLGEVGPYSFTTGKPLPTLDPWYVTGFVEGDGSFYVFAKSASVGSQKRLSFGFKVSQADYNQGILYALQSYFNEIGSISVDVSGHGVMKFEVHSPDDLLKYVVPHFDQYALRGSKGLNYATWRECLMLHKGLVACEGDPFKRILQLVAGMGDGRSFDDKYAGAPFHKDLDPQWVRGFVDAEGCFYAHILKTKPVYIDTTLEIAQSSHEVRLLASLRHFFGGSSLSPKVDPYDLESVRMAKRAVLRIKVRKMDRVWELFDAHPLLTDKQLDYRSLKAIWLLREKRAHLTPDGLERILALKAWMNNSRPRYRPFMKVWKGKKPEA